MGESNGTASRRRVLIATADEQIFAAAAGTLLAAGYEVLHTVDGSAVLVMAAEHAPELFLIDRDLPELDGVRLARHLRTGYAIDKGRIIILHPHDQPISYAAEVQANDVLPWPFTGVELLLCVSRHLDPEETSNHLPGATEE